MYEAAHLYIGLGVLLTTHLSNVMRAWFLASSAPPISTMASGHSSCELCVLMEPPPMLYCVQHIPLLLSWEPVRYDRNLH